MKLAFFNKTMAEYQISNAWVSIPQATSLANIFGQLCQVNPCGDQIYSVHVLNGGKFTFNSDHISTIRICQQFGAHICLAGEKRYHWLDKNWDVIAETPRMADVPLCDKYLICVDCVYVDGFAKKIAFNGLAGASWWNGDLFVWSVDRLMNISRNQTIDVSMALQNGGKIVKFTAGVLLFDASNTHYYASIICNQERKKIKEGECVICYSVPKKFMTYGCGHSIVCDVCHKKLEKKECPECRQAITVAIPTIPRVTKK